MTHKHQSIASAILVSTVLLGITLQPNHRLLGQVAPCTGSPSIAEISPGSFVNARYITSGPDGNLWFTSNFHIYKLTTAGVMTQYPPEGSPALPGTLFGVTGGPDGNVWFTEPGSNSIGRVTTEGVITHFTIPTAGTYPYGIVTGADGNLWFTESFVHKIGRITTDGVITEFGLSAGTFPLLITSGPDGNLWFTNLSQPKIGMITTSGVETEYAITTPGFIYPYGITAGTDGNVWFTEQSGNRIGRITPSGTITEFTIPTERAAALGIATDDNGNMWFAENEGNKIGRITTSGDISEFVVPTAAAGPWGITNGPNGQIWFLENNVGKVGSFVPCSPGVDSSSSSVSSSESSASSSSISSSESSASSSSISSSESSASSTSSEASSSVASSIASPDATADSDTHDYPLQAFYRGRGLVEQSAVLHAIFAESGLHTHSPREVFTPEHENIHPAAFESMDAETDWMLREHAACCSMYRYLKRLREIRPSIKPGYVDWMTDQVASALKENPVEIKAALLGQSHEHEHTSALVRSITEEGCALNSYTGPDEPAAKVSPDIDTMNAEHHLETSATGETLRVRQEEVPGEIAFSVMDGDAVVRDFGISHTKEMHLLVVRNDLRHFQHIHPERDSRGVWHVPFVPPAGGTYWIYADFVDTAHRAHTIRFERTFEGNAGPTGIEKDMRMEKIFGTYIVRLRVEPYSQGTLFTISILNEQQKDSPYLESYLGAMGHGIILTPEGDFIHTHPSPAGDMLTFHTPKLTKDFYRIFAQFQIQNEVITVDFDWSPTMSHE